ncbi:hypothetical protein EBL29_21220 [Salmonella enterica subsp. enterica serovar Cerro]|nr:hypothetical protein [Salmonella enterica subsp. enterica serovar Cerro]
MNIFSIINMAQAANPKADVTIRSGGHDSILIIWHWDGQYLNLDIARLAFPGIIMANMRHGESRLMLLLS